MINNFIIMGELNKPSKRTFWKAVSADATFVVHQGFTEQKII